MHPLVAHEDDRGVDRNRSPLHICANNRGRGRVLGEDDNRRFFIRSPSGLYRDRFLFHVLTAARYFGSLSVLPPSEVRQYEPRLRTVVMMLTKRNATISAPPTTRVR